MIRKVGDKTATARGTSACRVGGLSTEQGWPRNVCFRMARARLNLLLTVPAAQPQTIAASLQVSFWITISPSTSRWLGLRAAKARLKSGSSFRCSGSAGTPASDARPSEWISAVR